MTRNDIPTSWWEAQTLLDGLDYRKIANNTVLQVCEGKGFTPHFQLVLYETAVVTYCKGDKFILNSGGCKTQTTKNRMNRAIGQTPFMVTQWDNKWFVVNSYSHAFETKRQWRVPFQDGITITEEGIEL